MNEVEKKKYYDVIIEGLKQYDLLIHDVKFYVEESNVFFSLQGDQRYMAKIFEEESSKIEDNLIEMLVLTHTQKQTDIVVPGVIPSKLGEQIVFVDSAHFSIKKRMVIYTYMEGIDLHENETDDLFYQVGVTMAKLHTATRSIVLPDELIPKKWDQVFYYRKEEAHYHQAKYAKYFSKEDISFLDDWVEYLNQKLPTYYEGEMFMLHGDLNPWNIKLHDGEIRLLDFEEGMIGTALHELAIMLFYYRYDDNFNYEKVKNAVLNGYRSISYLPVIHDIDIDLLIMARTTNFINYVLLIYDDPLNYIQSRIQRVKDFIEHYNIKIKT